MFIDARGFVFIAVNLKSAFAYSIQRDGHVLYYALNGVLRVGPLDLWRGGQNWKNVPQSILDFDNNFDK